MQFFLQRRPAAAGLALAALFATACSSGDTALAPSPNAPNAPTAGFRVGVEYSAADVAPGGNVEIGVGFDGTTPRDLGALQGRLRYDASKLEYVGIEDGQQAFIMVNSDAASDALRFSAVRVAGLQSTAATFVFRVKAADYTGGLQFAMEEAATLSDITYASAPSFPARRASDTEVSAFVSPRTFADYEQQATRLGLKSEPRDVLKRPGDATVYGDVNGTGTVASGDLVLVAGASVGNVIVVDTLVARDIALGGNVRPINSADGITVGFGDPCPLGVTCSAAAPFTILNAGTISSADQLAIASFLVTNPSVGINIAIPRSTPATGNRVIISGLLDAPRCSATPADCNWTRGNVYELQGRVFVDGGGVLNIQSGTRVEGNTGGQSGSPLIVGRQGQIFALGERTAPIVFTCTATTKSKGCWGGLAILGNAPLNVSNSAVAPVVDPIRNPGGAGISRTLEGTTDQTFGGGNATDNSGVIRFARIEYGGSILAANNELNGLTVGGVGSGTTLEYIQIHGGLDDGFEIFGGTVNARYLYITGNSDDAFDWSFGWQGAAQFVVIQQDSLDAEKGFEGDNAEIVAEYAVAPRANGPLYNFTVIGTLYPASTAGNVLGTTPNNVNDAIHVRRGNQSQIASSVIIGFPVILDLDDAATCTNAATDPEVRNSFIGGFTTLGNADTGDPACFRGATEADVLNNAALANLIGSADPAVAGAVLRRPFDVLSPDFRPREGAVLPAASALPAVNPLGYIVTTSYVGAVEPELANTRNNVPWYAGWVRGFQSNLAP